MTKSKNTFYILVRISAKKNIFRYVTGFKNRLIVKWDKNAKAMRFGKYEAEEIIQGLGINGHLAYLVTTPDFMADTMINHDDEF